MIMRKTYIKHREWWIMREYPLFQRVSTHEIPNIQILYFDTNSRKQKIASHSMSEIQSTSSHPICSQSHFRASMDRKSEIRNTE